MVFCVLAIRLLHVTIQIALPGNSFTLYFYLPILFTYFLLREKSRARLGSQISYSRAQDKTNRAWSDRADVSCTDFLLSSLSFKNMPPNSPPSRQALVGYPYSNTLHTSAHLLPVQPHSLDQFIEGTCEMGLRYADIVPLLNWHGNIY